MDILDRFAAVDTAAVSDALDSLGLPSGMGGLHPMTTGGPVLGYARTACLEPRQKGAAGAHILTGVVDGCGDADVIVIDTGGRTDVSSWGGILGLGAVDRGVRGVVIDGALRDVEENRQLGLSVFARGSVPATARNRLQQRSTGEPVRIAGRTVCEGDVVYVDATGFVVVPADRVEAVLAEAEAVTRRERAIAEDVRRGSSLRESMTDARLAGQEGQSDTAALPGTAAFSDALDALGLPGSLRGLHALRPGQRTVGPAFTVAYESVDADGGTVGDFLDDVPAGAVVVIDNATRTDCTVWGGIMSRIARRQGVAGTVINGTCRDTAIAAEVGYPLWSVSRFMRTGKDRVRIKDIQRPVVIDGVTIEPGDLIVADDDGAVAVPAHRWDEVRRRAAAIEEAEDRIVASVHADRSLREAREAHGYHSLQTREQA